MFKVYSKLRYKLVVFINTVSITYSAHSGSESLEYNELANIIHTLNNDGNYDDPNLKKSFWDIFNSLETADCQTYVDALASLAI